MKTDCFDTMVRPWCEKNGIDIVLDDRRFYTFSVHSNLDTEAGMSDAINELFDPYFKKRSMSFDIGFCLSMPESLAKCCIEYLSTNLLDSRIPCPGDSASPE